MVSPAIDDAFSRTSHTFLAWLQRSGTVISPKIELVDLRSRDAGRGVVAKEDIAEDEELFSVPRSSILTVESSVMPASAKEAIDDDWLSLITAMIYEHQRGEESTWKAYLDVLPYEFDTPMFWTEEELGHLEGSAMLEKIGRKSADEAFRTKVIPVIQQHSDAFKTNEMSEDQLLVLCHRMGSTIMAYAFDLEKPGSGPSNKSEEDGWEEDEEDTELLPKGMVPLADMLNADADRNNAKLYYEDDKVVMKSLLPIRASEEIFNDYGPLPTADVLRRYGYTTPGYAQYDVVEISRDLIEEARHELPKPLRSSWPTRIDYLESQGVLDDAYDVSRAANPESPQFSEELCVLLNTCTLPDADFAALKRKDRLPKPDLSQSALNFLRNILLRRRAMYKAETLDEHVRALSVGDAKPGSHSRLKMAQAVVRGELKVLDEAEAAVRGMLEPVEEGRKRKADGEEEVGKSMGTGQKRVKKS